MAVNYKYGIVLPPLPCCTASKNHETRASGWAYSMQIQPSQITIIYKMAVRCTWQRVCHVPRDSRIRCHRNETRHTTCAWLWCYCFLSTFQTDLCHLYALYCEKYEVFGIAASTQCRLLSATYPPFLLLLFFPMLEQFDLALILKGKVDHARKSSRKKKAKRSSDSVVSYYHNPLFPVDVTNPPDTLCYRRYTYNRLKPIDVRYDTSS